MLDKIISALSNDESLNKALYSILPVTIAVVFWRECVSIHGIRYQVLAIASVVLLSAIMFITLCSILLHCKK